MDSKIQISKSECYQSYVLLRQFKPEYDSKKVSFENVQEILEKYGISVCAIPESNELSEKWILEKKKIMTPFRELLKIKAQKGAKNLSGIFFDSTKYLHLTKVIETKSSIL